MAQSIRKTLLLAAGSVVVAATLAGCAAGSATGGPGPIAMAPGQSCESVRSELNKLDSRGVQSKFEQVSRGQKLAPAAQADVDSYNRLLNVYLGAQCHV